MFAVRHGPIESLRSFFKRFTEVKWQLKDVTDITIINAARCELRVALMAKRMARNPIHTMDKLFDKMEEYTRMEEDCVCRSDEASTAAASRVGNVEMDDRQPPSKAADVTAARTDDDRPNHSRQRGRVSSSSTGVMPPSKEDDRLPW